MISLIAILASVYGTGFGRSGVSNDIELAIGPLSKTYHAPGPVRLVIKNLGARREQVFIELQEWDIKDQFFAGCMSDAFNRGSKDKVHSFLVPVRRAIKLDWFPQIRPDDNHPHVGRTYRFNVMPLETMDGGGPAFQSGSFRLAPNPGNLHKRRHLHPGTSPRSRS